MTAAPRAQTIKQAKKAYKNSGPQQRISEQERKKLDRAVLLDERADRIREAAKRRKEAQKRKAEKDEKDKEARKRAGIGLATQLAGYSHTQKQMRKGMEGFLKGGKVGSESPKKMAAVEEDQGAWAEDFIDDDTLVEESEIKIKSSGEEMKEVAPLSQSFGDSIEDESFVEAEQSVMQEAHQEDVKPPLRTGVHNGHATTVQSAKGLPPQKEAIAVPQCATPWKRKASPIPPHPSRPRSPLKQPPAELDFWADFIASNTQIATEITPPKIISSKTLIDSANLSLSTKDFHFSRKNSEDVENRTPKMAILNTTSKPAPPPFKRPLLPASASKQPHQPTSRASMPPPPRPQSEVNPVPRTQSIPASAFGAFGLSTQLVQDLVEDNLDFIDEDDQEDWDAELQQLVDNDDGLSDSDTFGSDADFG